MRTKFTKAQRNAMIAALVHGTVRRIEPGALKGSATDAFQKHTLDLLVRDGILTPTEFYGQYRLTNGAALRAGKMRARAQAGP